jgi:hypothetical protein
MYLNDDFAGQLDGFDTAKNANIELVAGKLPSLIMRTGSKYARVALGPGDEGSLLTLVGKDGANRGVFGVGENGNPTMRLEDKDGKEVFVAPK